MFFIFQKIIVAGISVEVSVTSDICLYLSINQLCFIYSLFKSNFKFLFSIFHHDHSKCIFNEMKQSLDDDVFEKQDFDEFPFVIPTCFTHASTSSCVQSNKAEKTDHYDFVPFEVLVTAGTVSAMFYYYEKNVFENLRISENLDKTSNIPRGNHNIYHPPRLHPFLCICITQPHSYLLCQPCSQKFESSCFDLQLCGSPSDYVVKSMFSIMFIILKVCNYVFKF